MDARAVAEGFFGAWNRRDTAAIAAAFADDGSYADPAHPDGLDPRGTAAYAAALFAAFPDLSFATEDLTVGDDGLVWVRWLMTGTNSGPFRGLPPTGRAVSVPGVDLIRVEGDRVAQVRGFFDTAAVPRQLGMQVVVQPDAVGPFTFGVSTYASRATTEPGAVSLTMLERRSPEEYDEVRARARDTVSDLMGMPGFISWLGVAVADRHYTITAWESPEAVAGLRRSPAHAEAMERFFGPDFSAGAQTGVWTPYHLNGMWVRCAECGEMTLASSERCAAGHELPEPPAYW